MTQVGFLQFDSIFHKADNLMLCYLIAISLICHHDGECKTKIGIYDNKTDIPNLIKLNI